MRPLRTYTERTLPCTMMCGAKLLLCRLHSVVSSKTMAWSLSACNDGRCGCHTVKTVWIWTESAVPHARPSSACWGGKVAGFEHQGFRRVCWCSGDKSGYWPILCAGCRGPWYLWSRVGGLSKGISKWKGLSRSQSLVSDGGNRTSWSCYWSRSPGVLSETSMRLRT